jgi:hypothetical protein
LNLKSAGGWFKLVTRMASPEDREPFDETAVTRGRHRCFFCEADKSDEWRFVPKLNAFVCKACQEWMEKKPSEERETG